MEEWAPVEARLELWEGRYRRRWVGILDYAHVFQCQGEAYGLEVRAFNPSGITLKVPVYLGFHVLSERLVDKKRPCCGGGKKQNQDPDNPGNDLEDRMSSFEFCCHH